MSTGLVISAIAAIVARIGIQHGLSKWVECGGGIAGVLYGALLVVGLVALLVVPVGLVWALVEVTA